MFRIKLDKHSASLERKRKVEKDFFGALEDLIVFEAGDSATFIFQFIGNSFKQHFRHSRSPLNI